MPDRLLDAYDEAQSLLMEDIWGKYASFDQLAVIKRGLKAIEVLRADAELEHELSVQPSAVPMLPRDSRDIASVNLGPQ
jgi:hypothetical protein